MTTVAEATGYRPTRTFSVWTEVRRQASRRRTQLALGFMVALPLIVLAAFQLDSGNDRNNRGGRGEFSSLVNVATSGGLNFALVTVLFSAGFLLVVVFALFCGDTVASEASWGSLRYLLAVPVPRGRLLGVKLVVAIGYCLLAELLLVAVGGAVLLNILSSILDQITALGSLRSFLPTHFANAWLGLLTTPLQTDDIVRGCVSSVAYAVLFFGLAWWRFLRKDIVS